METGRLALIVIMSALCFFAVVPDADADCAAQGYSFGRAVYARCTSCGSTLTNITFLVNDTAFFMGATPQYVWLNALLNSSSRLVAYLCYDSEADYAFLDASVAYTIPFEVDSGNRTGNGTVWPSGSPQNYHVVMHFSNSSLNNSVDNSEIATATGATLAASKILNGSLTDAVSEHVELPFDFRDDLDVYQNFSMSMWFRKNGTSCGTYECMFGDTDSLDGASGCDENGIWLASGNVSCILAFDGGYVTTQANTYCDGNWHHVVCGFRNESGTHQMSLFVDGVNKTGAFTAYGPQDRKRHAVISPRWNNANQRWNGYVDELRIRESPMTEAEIVFEFNNTAGSYNMSYLGAEEASAFPYYSAAIAATPDTPQDFGLSVLQMNITWADDDGHIESAYAEHNFSGASVQTSMANYTAANWSLSLNMSFMAGYFEYRYCAIDNGSRTNCTAYFNYTIDKAASGIAVSASPSWTASEDTSVTLSCTAPTTATLKIDGVPVSNPYVVVLGFGIYNVSCTITDSANYTTSSASGLLSITSGGFGCTDNTTFAFESNFTVPAGNISVLLDFSGLVDDYLARGDLGDVYPLVNTTPSGWRNGSNFIVNTTGYAGLQVTIRFGNWIADYNYSVRQDANASLSFDHYVINEYMLLTFTDERTGAVQLPPGANVTKTLFIFCSGGISGHNITGSRMLVATFERADEIKAQVQYSVTEIYSRSYAIDADAETMNVYLVDADQDQVVQLLIQLQDATGDFGSSLFRAKKYIEGTQRVITEHYFDAENKVITYLINGDKYTLTVDNGDEDRTVGFLYVDSVDLTKTITIGETLTTNQSHGNLSFGLYNVSDAIVFALRDAAGLTSSAEMWIYNSTDDLIYYINSTNKTAISFTYAVPTVNATYKVHVKVHHSVFGESSIDFWAPMFSTAFTYFNPASIFEDADLVGTIPGGISFEDLVGAGGIIGTAMLFTATTGPLGGIIAALVAAAFVTFGWYGIPMVLIGIALALAIINKLTEDKREA